MSLTPLFIQKLKMENFGSAVWLNFIDKMIFKMYLISSPYEHCFIEEAIIF